MGSSPRTGDGPVGGSIFGSSQAAGSLYASAEVRVENRNIEPPPSQAFAWRGSVPAPRWMNFYTKGLSSLVSIPGLTLEVRFQIPRGEAVTDATIEATAAALRELGLSDNVDVFEKNI